MQQLIHTEKLTPWKVEGEYNTIYSVFKIVSLYVAGKDFPVPFFDWRRVMLSEVPEGQDVWITYMTEPDYSGRCLSYDMLELEYYKSKYNMDGVDCMQIRDQWVKTFMQEAINMLRIQTRDKRFEKQYYFNVGKTDYACSASMQADEYTPRQGMLMTDKWIYLKYSVVNDEIKPVCESDVEIENYRIGYQLPDMTKIQQITSDWHPIEYKQFRGYFFFDTEDSTVVVDYYTNLDTCENDCIEFESTFWRIPVLYALYEVWTNMGDERRYEWFAAYERLLKIYKKHLKNIANDKKPYVSDFATPKRYGTHRRSHYPTNYVR